MNAFPSKSLSDNRKSAIQNPKWLGLSVIAFVLVAPVALARAQQPTKIPRIGYLGGATGSNQARIEALRQGLRELGYVEGKNIIIEWRYAEGNPDREHANAVELVRLKVDVIVTVGSNATRAAKEATATIPIVMTQDPDPIGNGFVASLARPGGNITGLATLSPETSGKLLEILKEIIPRLSRLAVMGNSANPGDAQTKKETERAARRSRCSCSTWTYRTPETSRPHSEPQTRRVRTPFWCLGTRSLMLTASKLLTSLSRTALW